MTRSAGFVLLAIAALTVLRPLPAGAEPMFLSKQYTRCTTCHISPNGGGLLTEYGRSLSHRELSTFSEPLPSHGDTTRPPPGEEAFLYNAFGDSLGPVSLGIDLRPSRLQYDFGDFSMDRNLLMTADVLGAYQVKGWTFYGQGGRVLDGSDWRLGSTEHWAGRQPEQGFGFRAGRFLPAYGIRFADHTSLNRVHLGLTQYDQIYGVEVSQSAGRYLLQASLGPGYAESLVDDDDDGREAFTATGRFQVDLSPRLVLVASGLFRDEARLDPRHGAGGIALGVAPIPRLTIWSQADTVFRAGTDDPAFVLVNETSFEAFRGIWLKISPQARLGGGEETPDLLRLQLGAVLLPRTHWNVNLSYFRDRNRTSEITTQIFLAQLHLYL